MSFSSQDVSFEKWRTTAVNYTTEDKIGKLISRTIECMQRMVDDRSNHENLEFLMESLENERKLAIEHDDKRDLPLRDLLFLFCMGLESTIQVLSEDAKNGKFNQSSFSAADQNSVDGLNSSDNSDLDESILSRGGDGADAAAAAAAANGQKSAVRPLKSAARATKPETSKTCDKCNLHFTTYKGFKKHMASLCGKRCIKCKMEFKSVTALKQHRQLQHSTAAAAAAIAALTFECDQCEARFKTVNSRRTHMLIHTPAAVAAATAATTPTALLDAAAAEESFKCDKCGQTLLTRRGFKKHINSLCNTRCIECLEVFKSATALMQHRKLQHGTAAAAAKAAACEFECTECGVKLKSARILSKHMLMHGGASFSCNLCERTFKVSQNLDHHMRTKHGLKLYECEFCKEKFNRYDDMLIHRKVHYENPIADLVADAETRIEKKRAAPYQNSVMRCIFCANGFYHVSTYSDHVKKLHKLTLQEAGISFRCDCGHISRSGNHNLCEMTNFTVIRDNAEKAAVGSGEEEGAAAAAAAKCVKALNRKRVAVSGGRKCDRCDRRFTSIVGYKLHMESLCFTRCSECLMTFKSSLALTQHTKLKHGSDAEAAEIEKKNFVCDECGARLISSDSLRDHKRTHGKDRIPCEKCDMKFTLQHQYRNHMRKVHNAKTFECDICNEKFSFRDELRTHKSKDHADE